MKPEWSRSALAVRGSRGLLHQKVPADTSGDPCDRCLNGIPRQMSVPGSRLDLRMPQQLSDHCEAFTKCQRAGRKGMT